MAGISSWTEFPNHSLIGDWTVTQITAGQELQSPKSGTNGGIGLTPNSVQSTTVPQNYLWDVTDMEVTSPVASDGSFPDCQLTFFIGSKKIDDIMMIDGSMSSNMFPRGLLTIAGKKLIFGESLRSLLLQEKANPGSVSNMALRATGLKVADSLTVSVKSLAGWGNTAAAIVPLRVEAFGDIMQESDIAPLTQYWKGSVSLNVTPADPFSAFHSPTMPFTAKSWGTLPGGVNQGNVKIYKRIAYAFNAQATVVGNNYIFSQQDSLLGNINAVVDPQHDLGDAFASGNDAFLWQEFGVRTTGPCYFGWRIGNTIVPQSTTLGAYITPNSNDWQYGAVAPQIPDTSRFFSLRDAKILVRPFAYHQNVVPFINTGGLATLAANSVSIAKAGILIQQS